MLIANARQIDVVNDASVIIGYPQTLSLWKLSAWEFFWKSESYFKNMESYFEKA